MTLPENPLPPELAEEAGPEMGLPLALAGLVSREFLATEQWRNQQKRAVREGAHPKVLKFADAVVRRFKRAGVPMFAHCIVRTPEEQARLFKEGLSKDSPDDGLWPHRACAVEIVHSVRGWNMNAEEWRLVGHLGKEVSDQMGLSMTWGGHWSFYDPAHWELKDWKNLHCKKDVPYGRYWCDRACKSGNGKKPCERDENPDQGGEAGS